MSVEIAKILIKRNGTKIPLEKGDFVHVKGNNHHFDMEVYGFLVEEPCHSHPMRILVVGKMDKRQSHMNYALPEECFL